MKNPTMTGKSARRNSRSPQVIEFPSPGGCKPAPQVLSQTAMEIAYRWMFRRIAQRVLATKYKLPRPVIEQVILEVLSGEHGPFVVPSVRLSVERRAA